VKPIRKAVFPVGGRGTRFLPATKALPKEMLPIVDKPLIEYAVEEARAAGLDQMIFVTGRGKSTIEDHFDAHTELESALKAAEQAVAADAINGMSEPGEIAYVRQMEPLGLGHAVWCARRLLRDEPFAVILADDLLQSDRPTIAELIEVHADYGGNVVALMDVPETETSRYGIVDPGVMDDRIVEVAGLVEKPAEGLAPSNLAVVGRYILQPEVLDYLAHGRRGSGGEIQLTDAMQEMIGKSPFHGLRINATRFDCGSKLGWLEANVAFGLDRPDMGDVRGTLQRLLDAQAGPA
jgi:UTP--glucose-1-phosphate uridylyltransferase